jgi:hypothetical protein
MNAQSGAIITLLAALVGLELWSKLRDLNSPEVPAQAPPPAFSVTRTGDGQYVMRANDNLFFCVNNRCTTIQLIVGRPENERPAAAAPEGN